MIPSRRTFLRTSAAAALLSCAIPRATAENKDAPELNVALLSGSAEYHSDESLTAFAEDLEKNYRIRCTKIFAKDGAGDRIPNLEAIDDADLLILFTRRLKPPQDQLDRFKKFCDSGKPILGVRTASHAFQDWLAFDKQVLGGNYTGHYHDGPITQVAIVEKAKDHAILAGVEPFSSKSTLYKNTGVADDVELLLTGSIPDHTEPLAWTRLHKGARIFYTSLGSTADFKNPPFARLITNALFWTTQRDPAKLKR
jgi:type 1 glutamine amidotransferase